jgi:hypothetical protein
MPYSPIGESPSPLHSFTFNVDPVKHMSKYVPGLCQARVIEPGVLAKEWRENRQRAASQGGRPAIHRMQTTAWESPVARTASPDGEELVEREGMSTRSLNVYHSITGMGEEPGQARAVSGHADPLRNGHGFPIKRKGDVCLYAKGSAFSLIAGDLINRAIRSIPDRFGPALRIPMCRHQGVLRDSAMLGSRHFFPAQSPLRR